MRTILIVDDDLILLTVFPIVLASDGYRVQTASSARTALQVVEQQRPDLVLLDLHLGAALTGGLDLLRRMQARVAGLPVVVVSGYPATLMREAARAAGAVEYLEKPVTIEGLKRCVAQVLSHAGSRSPVRAPRLEATLPVAPLSPARPSA